MTKRIFSALLAVVLAVGACGCAQSNAGTDLQITTQSTPEATISKAQTTTVATTTEKEKITSTSTTTVTTIDEKAVEEEYKSTCETISFKDLARNPDSYIGKVFTFTGKVIQVLEPEQGEEVTMRINVTKDEYGYWEDTIIAAVKIPKEADRILEDDIITIYGDCAGLYTYESVFGQNISLPAILIRYYNLVDSENENNTETVSTEISVETTLPENKNTGVEIYDDEYVNISYLECETSGSREYMVFYVINKTDVELTFQSSSLAINGESLGSVSGSDDIAPMSKGKIRFSTKEDFPTTSPNTISGVLKVIDFSNALFDRSYEVKFINLEV